MMDLLREGCYLDGSCDFKELGAVPEKNWQKATPYSPSFKNLPGRLTEDDIVFGRKKDPSP